MPTFVAIGQSVRELFSESQRGFASTLPARVILPPDTQNSNLKNRQDLMKPFPGYRWIFTD